VQAGQSNEVVLIVGVQVQDGVADLAHVDSARERRLLSIVTLQAHAVLLVPDAVCGDGRVVRNLLTDKLGDSRVIFPAAEEELAEERVERLLLAAQLFVARGVLLLQCAEEPLEDEHGTLLRVGFGGGCDEQAGHLSPVGAELGKGGGGENEGRGGHGGEVAIEGGDRLVTVSVGYRRS
jgi:hypothetical protein